MSDIEFWPDYGPGPLWTDKGKVASPTELGLPGELAVRLDTFNAAYEEWRLPREGPGDPAYIAEGIALLAAVRSAIRPEYRVIVTEPWWGEPPIA